MPKVRKGQVAPFLPREEFRERFHDTFDRDPGVQEEVRNVARALIEAVQDIRAGKLRASDSDLEAPRPK